ncbi:MAG: hypothetical protein ACFFF4_11415 [Candidatus Thorarchaeota archaeon]
MQWYVLDWIIQRLGLIVIVLGLLGLVLYGIYVKVFVSIIPGGAHYKHYRMGRLLQEDDGERMLLKIPLVDSIEIDMIEEPIMR